jgi:hypothetical protein
MESTEVSCGLYIRMFGEGGRRFLLEIRFHSRPPQLRRSAIIFLISAMALPGLSPFGQVRVQLRMVWAPIEPERVLKLVQPLADRLVAAVSQPPPSLQKHGGTQEAVPFHQ